jgi:hypothetical protein
LVASVGEDVRLLAVQQAVAFDHVVDLGRRAAHGVHHARVSIHPNVRLHAEVPLVALLGLMDLGVALTGLVLRGAGRCDQRGVHHRARLEHQALAKQQFVDGCQDLVGQLVLLQQMTKPQDRRLIGQPITQAQTCELPKQRNVVQRLFHRRVTQRKPLLHEVDAQHRQHRKRRAARLALTAVGCHHRHQVIPRHDAIHLRQELPLARALGAQVQAKVSLLHGSDRRLNFTLLQARLSGGLADLP